MTSAQNLLRPLSGSRFFIVIAFAFMGLWANAQEPEVSHFVIHKVKKKETLGKIAKRYDIPVDFIFKYNPKAKDGIKKRDKLGFYEFWTLAIVPLGYFFNIVFKAL